MSGTPQPDPLTSGGLWELALGLLVVCTAIFVLGWVMRRFQPGSMGMSAHMRIVGSLALGPRERLMIVDCAGRQLVLGVTQTQITQLTELDGVLPAMASSAKGDFAEKLRDVLRGKQP